MVVDACVAVPPCALGYVPNEDDENLPGSCRLTRGPESATACADPTDPVVGGRPASLVVATGVPGMVLFEDSALRMFGDLDALDTCDAVSETSSACLDGHDGVLELAGWPAAGESEPLPRLRVRSLALVPGLVQSKGDGPCHRAKRRRDGLFDGCRQFVRAFRDEGNLPDTDAPYPSRGALSDTSLAVVGEAFLAPETDTPDPGRWISTLVVPVVHPLVLALRRDVAPEALEPDGLVGTALFGQTDVILDYTDRNPGLRVSCLSPSDGSCLAVPDCADAGHAACCFGLPVNLLVDLIQRGKSDTCCAALSAAQLAEIQAGGEFCQGLDPP
jgi:hypothetical protein